CRPSGRRGTGCVRRPGSAGGRTTRRSPRSGAGRPSPAYSPREPAWVPPAGCASPDEPLLEASVVPGAADSALEDADSSDSPDEDPGEGDALVAVDSPLDCDSPDALDSLDSLVCDSLASPAVVAADDDPAPSADERAELLSAAAAFATSPWGCAARKLSAPDGTFTMPRLAARDSMRSPAANSEFSMLSAAFSRCSIASCVSARPMPPFSRSSPNCSVTIPISANATRPIHTRPRIRRSIKRC